MSSQMSDQRNASKRELAYDGLRRLLILQQIPEGVRLREAEWAKRLNVNRSALREAFARLAAEGLIEVGEKTGYFVPVLTKLDVTQVIAVRIALEGAAIEAVCEQGLNTPSHLKAMQDACDLMGRLIDDNYHLSVAETDRRFHGALIEASNNRRLAIAYQHAPLPIIHPDVISGQEWSSRIRQTHEEHTAVLKAILGGQVAEAKRLLRDHLTAYWRGAHPTQKAE
jgi:DNA-binding GntR family transcriptional regulator